MLKRASSVIVAFIAMIGLTGTAMAEDAPKGRWWRNSNTVKQLNLSKDEIKELDSAYKESRRRMIKQKSRVESEQFQLEEMVESRKFDEKAIRQQHRKLEKARSDLAEEQFGFVVKSRKIIGHDRFQKLVDIQRDSKKRRRSRK